jgi:hypothetical protein
MKRHYILILTLLLAAGCQKLDEDPKGNLTPGTYFKTASDLDAAVAAVYLQLAVDAAYANISNSTPCFGSDDLTTDPGLNKLGFRLFDQLNGNSDADGRLNNVWQGPWTAIYQANNVIANYEKVDATDEVKKSYAGQAFFLRAFSYYMLVRTFGPLPVIDKPLDVDARPPRDSVSSVYNLVVSDLKTAIDFLPASFPGAPGKANQLAAKALLAEVYLTMAGWPLNQTANYALAAEQSDAVMKSGQYTLVPDYAKVFTTNNTTESIFSLQFNVAGGLPQRTYGASCMPLDEVALNGNSGWDDFYPEISFYLNAPKCARTDATFYTTIKLLQPDKTYKLVPWNSTATHAGHPYYKKFRAGVGDGIVETDNAILSASPSTNKTLDIIRYPMVLLNYAEASAMAANAPTGESYAAINQVRRRAGLPDLTPGLPLAAFRDSVVQERAYEFAGEFGIRWFDIVRLQLLPQILAKRSNLENPVNPAVANNPAALAQKYIAPIPTNEMLRNPQWQQNPGY